MSDERALRRAVALVQGAGGVGLVLLAVKVAMRARPSVLLALVVATLALVAAAFLLASALLWRGGRGGRALSAVLQFLQLPHLVTGPIAYLFCTPLSLAAGFEASGRPRWQAVLRPALAITPDADPDVAWIGVNLLALACLLALALARPRRVGGS